MAQHTVPQHTVLQNDGHVLDMFGPHWNPATIDPLPPSWRSRQITSQNRWGMLRNLRYMFDGKQIRIIRLPFLIWYGYIISLIIQIEIWLYWSVKVAPPPTTQTSTFQHPNMLTALWWCLGYSTRSTWFRMLNGLGVYNHFPAARPSNYQRSPNHAPGQSKHWANDTYHVFVASCCFNVTTEWVLPWYGGMTKMMPDHIFWTRNSNHFNIELRRGSTHLLATIIDGRAL